MDRLQEDALSALVNLGYKPAEVKDTLTRIARYSPAALSLQAIIREALKELAKG
jgi:Holliday junction DNA helicase RuvA